MPINNEKHGDRMDDEEAMPSAPDVMPPSTDTYTNIYAWVQDLLEESEATLPGTRLTRYVESTLRFLRSTYACLPAYADFSDLDRSAMDEAVGHLVAVRYRAKHPKKTLGEVIELKQGPVDYKYAQTAASPLSLEEAWMEQAYTVLQEISCIADVLEEIRSVSLFQTAGKRTAQRARGINTRSLNPLFTVLADEWDAEQHEPTVPFFSLFGY